MDKRKYRKQKVNTYVSIEDVTRLQSICKKYGYNSIYQLLQYLIHCFLRVADPVNDPDDDPIPEEIEKMFINNSEWEEHHHSFGSHKGMIKRKKPDQRKIKTANDI